MQDTWQKYTAEALATFIFVFAAAGSVLANYQTGGSLGTLGVALVHGLALAAMIYAVWHISGAHLNPAVTIALWATGHIKTVTGIGYILAQLVGSVVAALFIKIIFTGVSPQYFLGTTALGTGVTTGMGILVEALLTFFLVWTVFATMVDKRGNHMLGGLCVGLIMAVAVMIGGHITMGALNPARWFGLALVSSHWINSWVYLAGPVIGGLVAGFVYHFGFMKKHGG
ncbi:MAG: aquaporin [Patescibacteria group bacterium]